MRKVKQHEAADGTVTYRVRFRSGGTERSETFRREDDAGIFASLINSDRKRGVQEALAWLAAKQEERDTYTFAEWFEVYVDQLTGVTPRTREDYRKMSVRYLGDLHLLPLPLITRMHITSLVNKLDTTGGRNGDGLGHKTIKNVVHTVSSAMALAVEEGHIPKNPCRRVRLPKPGLELTDARFLEYEEFGALYDEIPTHYQPLVSFLVGTGLRWSEATALPPGAVSMSRGTVRVERAWKWGGAGVGWVLGPPKSPKARRTVNAALVALKAVHPLPDRDLLFLTPKEHAVRHNNFYNRIWLPATKRAGLEGTRIHDLRHTHASWLISDGQSLEAVQDQLGHESILTTRKVYGHLLPAIGVAVGKSASQSLEAALAVSSQ
ncbi:MAG TPA: site-specific integrase [Aeromicrobium sp.]|nr:site-specific integrase [Aeromicrobium sp.]HKY57642.1 site-specific integrase [Aeromicrobium sp.]